MTLAHQKGPDYIHFQAFKEFSLSQKRPGFSPQNDMASVKMQCRRGDPHHTRVSTPKGQYFTLPPPSSTFPAFWNVHSTIILRCVFATGARRSPTVHLLGPENSWGPFSTGSRSRSSSNHGTSQGPDSCLKSVKSQQFTGQAHTKRCSKRVVSLARKMVLGGSRLLGTTTYVNHTEGRAPWAHPLVLLPQEMSTRVSIRDTSPVCA